MIQECRHKPSSLNKFKPGDVIRVTGGDSAKWVKRVPLVVVGYHFGPGAPSVVDLNGDDPTLPLDSSHTDYWWNHVLDEDCELDVFLTEARRACELTGR